MKLQWHYSVDTLGILVALYSGVVRNCSATMKESGIELYWHYEGEGYRLILALWIDFV